MNFQAQELLWAIPILAALMGVRLSLDRWRRRRVLREHGGVGEMTNSASRQRRWLATSLFGMATALCVVALSRPTRTGEVSWRQRGIDIVFAIDASVSMLANDVYPNRFERSLREAKLAMKALAADRVATMVFAGGAAHFPLTHDHLAAQQLFAGVRPSDVAPGADLGLALRVASCLLRSEIADPSMCELLVRSTSEKRPSEVHGEAPAIPERGRALVLFTDGEDREGTALREADLAKALGIDVFIVAVGTEKGARVPTLDAEGERSGWQTTRSGAFEVSNLNVSLLRSLREASGGHYFELGAGTWRGDELSAALRDLARGDLDARVIRQPLQSFDRFLFPAFLLLIIEGWLSLRRRSVALPHGRKEQS